MKRLIGLVAVLILSNAPIACIEEDDCGGFTPRESKIKNLSARVGYVQSGTFIDQKLTSFNQATIQVLIDELTLSHMTDRNYSNWFVNQAFACSPPLPELVHKLDAVTIFGSEAVESDGKIFEAGSDLSSLFLVAGSNIGINEYIKQLDTNTFAFEGQSMLLQLSKKPDAAINQKLQLSFKFDDGLVILIETLDTFEVSV